MSHTIDGLRGKITTSSDARYQEPVDDVYQN